MKNDFKKGFFKALEILKDYLPDIVISGGWAPLVYYHYLLSKKEVEPLRTKDIDIVVPGKLAKRRNRTVGEILEVRVPSPGAFIFQKGLIFVRRTRREKSAKDLYYIFDILSNCQELREKIIKEFHKFKRNYHSRWLSSFVTNLEGYFSDISSEGVYLVLSQRPEGAFPGMNEEQFKQYELGIFKEFISQIKSL